MDVKHISTTDKLRAQSLNRMGLEHFTRWEMEQAINLFTEAARLDDTESEYHLNLARSHVRLGNYDLMLKTLGNYIRTERDMALVTRFEHLFSNALDEVEQLLTSIMPQHGMRLEVVGAAIQMWIEYRVTLGKQYLDLSHPEEWAAALDYTVRKVCIEPAPIEALAKWYKTNETAIRTGHGELLNTLDIMPCDYRYFRGDENPLDKLVEAALMLEDLEREFRQEE
ncbi:MAG: hypothetical protein R3264_06360 [Anaerolineae bacterium]|nr:hypothetical protein [Anaerolineae bacterium]